MILDPEDRLGPDILDYGTAAVRSWIPEVSFLWHLDTDERVRIRITPTRPGSTMRELRVEQPGESYGLTRRELQVLTLMCGGLTNREISATLGSSVRTVTTQAASILLKVGRPTRAGAVAMAMDQALLSLPIPGPLEGFQSLTAGRLEIAVRRDDPPPVRLPMIKASRLAPLRIGHLVPATLPDEAVDMRQGSQLAVEHVNARGGVGGRPLEHVSVLSDVFDIEALSEGLEDLGAKGVDALVIGYNGDYERMETFLKAVADHGVPMLHASTSGLASDIVSDNPGALSNVFQLCGPDRLYGHGVVRFVQEVMLPRSQPRLRTKTIVAVDPPPGMSVLDDDAAAALERAGWHVARIERRSAVCDSDEIARIVADVAAVHADLVLVPSFFDEELLRAVLISTGMGPDKPLVYAIFTAAFAGFLDRHGDVAERLIWATQTGTYPDGFGMTFRTDFERRFGRSPGRSQASIHYDAVQLLTRAWNEVENPRRASEVSPRLRNLVHRGVNGTYWMNNPTQSPRTLLDHTLDASVAQAQLIFQVQNGRHRVIAPAPYAQATLLAR